MMAHNSLLTIIIAISCVFICHLTAKAASSASTFPVYIINNPLKEDVIKSLKSKVEGLKGADGDFGSSISAYAYSRLLPPPKEATTGICRHLKSKVHKSSSDTDIYYGLLAYRSFNCSFDIPPILLKSLLSSISSSISSLPPPSSSPSISSSLLDVDIRMTAADVIVGLQGGTEDESKKMVKEVKEELKRKGGAILTALKEGTVAEPSLLDLCYALLKETEDEEIKRKAHTIIKASASVDRNIVGSIFQSAKYIEMEAERPSPDVPSIEQHTSRVAQFIAPFSRLSIKGRSDAICRGLLALLTLKKEGYPISATTELSIQGEEEGEKKFITKVDVCELIGSSSHRWTINDLKVAAFEDDPNRTTDMQVLTPPSKGADKCMSLSALSPPNAAIKGFVVSGKISNKERGEEGVEEEEGRRFSYVTFDDKLRNPKFISKSARVEITSVDRKKSRGSERLFDRESQDVIYIDKTDRSIKITSKVLDLYNTSSISPPFDHFIPPSSPQHVSLLLLLLRTDGEGRQKMIEIGDSERKESLYVEMKGNINQDFEATFDISDMMFSFLTYEERNLLDVYMLIGDSRAAKNFKRKVATFLYSMSEGEIKIQRARVVNNSFWASKEAIRHIFSDPARVAPFTTPLLFLILTTVVPIVLFISGLMYLNVNVNGVTSIRVANAIFHISFALLTSSIAGLLFFYWWKLNLMKLLGILLFIVPPTLYCGNRVLCDLKEVHRLDLNQDLKN